MTPADRPTLWFIGVSTAQSSIMRVFPEWARHLGLGNLAIRGMDFVLHDRPERYRAAVAFLKADPLSRGALVTTHKLDLYAAARDLFDEIDPHARLMAETSCLSKRAGRLVCHAKDPISAGLALDGFLPEGHFARTRADVFAMGAGGSTIALTWHLSQPARGADRPTRVVVSDRSRLRLDHLRAIHDGLGHGVAMEFVHAPRPEDNDAVLPGLAAGSLVVNATGLGKDAPGSPLTGLARFPEGAIAWDLNYRGDLVFLDQARAQAAARALRVEDGWTYFIHGWMQVIAEVFAIPLPVAGPGLDAIAAIAARAAGRAA
jgi:shikimate 5-dehydrogenase